MNWQEFFMAVVDRLMWAGQNALLFAVAFAGSLCSYLLYSFPESRRLRRVLGQLFPKVENAARLHILVTALIGTFISTMVFRPGNTKEAVLAGLVWLGFVRRLVGDDAAEGKTEP